jgi:hypothetical protein
MKKEEIGYRLRGILARTIQKELELKKDIPEKQRKKLSSLLSRLKEKGYRLKMSKEEDREEMEKILREIQLKRWGKKPKNQ